MIEAARFMTVELPRGWEEVEFGEIVEDSAFGPRFSGEMYADDGNIATLRTTDMSEDGKISYEQMPFARLDELRFSKHFLQKGDLVISRSGRIGTTAVFDQFDAPVLPGAFCIRFRLKDNAHPYFFRYFFNSSVGQQLILSIAQGAAQQNISSSNMLKLHVPLPPVSVQDSITDTLLTYDHLIDNNNRRIALLEESVHLLYREWFVHLRFLGCDQVKVVDGVPEGWKKVELSELASVNQKSIAKRSAPENIQYVDISSVSTGSINEIQPLRFADAPSRAQRVVQHGDVIWSMVRPGRRSYSLVLHPPENLIASTGFAVLTPEKVPSSFLYSALTMDFFVGHLENVATGAAYPAVKPKDFEAFQILCPSETLLRKFDEYALSVHEQIHNLKMQNQKLREARDRLLPRLMNGSLAV